MLAHPDPSLAFIVEVDTSEAGIGAVLSQHSGTRPNLRPCAFFSKSLSLAEQNYDVGDRELLSRLGGMDLRGLNTIFSSGLTTVIWSTSGQRGD
jgi:hypothetical protein